jgi:hypothetical protein
MKIMKFKSVIQTLNKALGKYNHSVVPSVPTRWMHAACRTQIHNLANPIS